DRLGRTGRRRRLLGVVLDDALASRHPDLALPRGDAAVPRRELAVVHLDVGGPQLLAGGDVDRRDRRAVAVGAVDDGRDTVGRLPGAGADLGAAGGADVPLRLAVGHVVPGDADAADAHQRLLVGRREHGDGVGFLLRGRLGDGPGDLALGGRPAAVTATTVVVTAAGVDRDGRDDDDQDEDERATADGQADDQALVRLLRRPFGRRTVPSWRGRTGLPRLLRRPLVVTGALVV